MADPTEVSVEDFLIMRRKKNHWRKKFQERSTEWGMFRKACFEQAEEICRLKKRIEELEANDRQSL